MLNQPGIFISGVNPSWPWVLSFLYTAGLDLLMSYLGFLHVLERDLSDIFLFSNNLVRLLNQGYADLIKLAILFYYLEKLVQIDDIFFLNIWKN